MTHGFTRAFLVAAAMMLTAAAIVLVGLVIKHRELSGVEADAPVHVG